MNSRHKNRYLNLYFQIHQPRRLGRFSFFDIGTDRDYFDDGLNQMIMRRVANNCYLPANRLLLRMINRYPSLRITFSISGTALKQMEMFAPAVLESFRQLAATGSVEFISETFFHSLACLMGPEEFGKQIDMHADKIEELFGVRPSVFRNTELIYNDEIGRLVHNLGFNGIYADGIDSILAGQSPNMLYRHPDHPIHIFLRNYRLSDDIAFRFSEIHWKEWPLTPAKYMEWLSAILPQEGLVNLSMDYETFGEHQKEDTGIFEFLEGILVSVAKHKQIRLVTPSEAIALLKDEHIIRVPEMISWADEERDLSAWLGNNMQRDAFDTLTAMQSDVEQIGHPGLTDIWRYLQTSDHFYYMSTKDGNDRGVHNYFSPYPSPYEAFMNYMNILTDFGLKLKTRIELGHQKERGQAVTA